MNLVKRGASAITFMNVNLVLVGLVYLFSSTFTRLVLLVTEIASQNVTIVDFVLALCVGFIIDTFIALCLMFLYSLFLVVFPQKWFRFRFGRWLTFGGLFMFIYAALYLIVLELFFFAEFSSRLNYVAVDYLLYPHEVFVNIWETYPVPTVLLAVLALSVTAVWFLRRRVNQTLEVGSSLGRRVRTSLGLIAVSGVMYFSLSIDTSRVSDNRILNEIAGNGIYNFWHAFVTNELDYDLYYATIDETKALECLRRQIKTSDAKFIDSDVTTLSVQTLDRQIVSENPTRRFNIVLVLEESFGSEFIGSLKPDGKNLTPHFDSLASEGLLFTKMYATGNRTVRGLEASIISYPPIPGRSIVKRPDNENLFTLASALKEQDYQTIFLYGGRAYFDNFSYFASHNYFDQIIDETNFSHKTFSTIWGVCDEDLFSNALLTFDSLHNQGQPFFATMITVSNHTPFTYPDGKIPYDPEERTRENAVRYADYAIGKFIADAKSHDFFDSTLFIFMADHGARVYGSQEIPLDSYEIPLLFYSPALIPEGGRNDRLSSQLDLSPTILDLLDFNYRSQFFGRSLLRPSGDDDWILLSHNRDVGMLRNDTLAVLGIQGAVELWLRDSSNGELLFLGEDSQSTLSHDAISYFQIAYKMYKQRQLRAFQSPARQNDNNK